jgi:glycosyltransferase involved in cell wall biosynthesis
MVKLGLIVFANTSGLGAQTRRLAQMLQPDRLLIIDSTPFSVNKTQHFEWYEEFESVVSWGFPDNEIIPKFVSGLTHVFSCENPYNFNMISWGEKYGYKTICQVNYEFSENIAKKYLPVPDLFLMPSHWKLEKMKELYGDRVRYLPPPIDPEEFSKARIANMNRSGKPRLLHIVGTIAHEDRNGTLDLLSALKHAKSDFELIVRTQHQLPEKYRSSDPRVVYELDDKPTNSELYEDFDALILPRRYGGLSLTTNEALMSGLPVVMTNITPNNRLLPGEWLVDSEWKAEFRARTLIDVFSAKHHLLAQKIDWLVSQDLGQLKRRAYDLGMQNFSFDVLKPQYEEIISSL